MEWLGHHVEAIIGKAKHARMRVESRGGVQPVLSVESQLSPHRLRELIDSASEKVLLGTIPSLKGQDALEVGEGPVALGAKLLASQARMAVGLEIGGASIGRQGDVSRGFVVRGELARMPFPPGCFAYVVARLATTLQGDMVRAFREIGRVIEPGGQGVIIDYHPFGLFAKKGSGRLRPADSGIERFEDYYRLSRQSGFRVIDVREAVVDESLRGFFHEQEIGIYRNLKGTPLIAFLFIYKPKARAS